MVHVYIQNVLEKYGDIVNIIDQGVRSRDQVAAYLDTITSAYNYRLVSPQRNLVNAGDCEEVFGADYQLFLEKDDKLAAANMAVENIGKGNYIGREIDRNGPCHAMDTVFIPWDID